LELSFQLLSKTQEIDIVIFKSIGDVELEDLLGLPDSGVRENPELEFKSKVERPEALCKEVCAFANTFGGDLLIGVDDEGGEAASVPGEEPGELNLEQFDLKRRQQIRSGIEPPVAFDLRVHELRNGRLVTHVKVDQSFQGPHRLTANMNFYERNGTESIPMQIDSLRNAFGRMATLEDQARTLHEKRMSAQAHISPDHGSAYLYMHVIPVAALLRRVQLPIAKMSETEIVHTPVGQVSESGIDHLGRWRKNDASFGVALAHTGRNGVIEGVMELKRREIGVSVEKFWEMEDDVYLINFVADSLSFLERNEISFPIFIFTSIINANSLCGRLDPRTMHFRPTSSKGFHADQLSCDVVYLLKPGSSATEVMEDTLNTIWNGFGFVSCPSYNPGGKWRGSPLRISN
jgi:hypothetical protein